MVEIPVPGVKADEINVIFQGSYIEVRLNTNSDFIGDKDFIVELGCEVEYTEKAILEYGVLSLTFNKAGKKKHIKVEEK